MAHCDAYGMSDLSLSVVVNMWRSSVSNLTAFISKSF